jgi:hypothetical protein
MNNFDVMKEMAKRNGKIMLSPLNNITNVRKVKAGTQITIGVAGDVVGKIALGEMVGGLILCDKAEFDAIKIEMDRALPPAQ